MGFLRKAALIVAGLVVTFFAIGIYVGQPEYEGGISKVEARTRCESLINGRSVNPATANIDSIPGNITGESVKFEWSPATLQMQNRMGAMIGVSATCKINLRSRAVEEFTISDN